MSLPVQDPEVQHHESTPTDSAPRAAASSAGEYRQFDNVERRNFLQEHVEIPLLVRVLRPPRGARVLEVGCGRGIALPVLSRLLRPSELVGIDIDASLVARAMLRAHTRRLPDTVQALQGDVRALPFDDEHFDLVIDFGTCYYVGGGNEGRRAALLEIQRVLRPGGRFIHETRVSQCLAHPVRSLGRELPWLAAHRLVPERKGVLWTMRRKVVRR